MSHLPEDADQVLWRPKRLWAPWWLALLLGGAIGVTMTFLRAYRAFVIPGAIVLGLIIAVITIATILRRRFHPEALEAPVSLPYLLWVVLLVFLIGPVQVVLVPDGPGELLLKALVLSLGLSACIYGSDRALFSPFAKDRKA